MMTAKRHTKFHGAVLLLLAVSPALAESPSPSAKKHGRAPGFLPPLHGLEEVGHQNVRLESGFWGPRLWRHHQTTIPHVLDKLEERHHIRNFDVAAKVVAGQSVSTDGPDSDAAAKALEGDVENEDAGGKSNAPDGIVGHSAFDSDVHKALEGACHTLGCTHDPALHQRVDGILDRILAAQEKDGYLVSYFTAKEPAQKWANLRLNHEMYNAGHFFEFAVAHHQLDGSTKALDAAKRFADHIDATFGPGKRYEVCGHQEVELALVHINRNKWGKCG